MKMWNNDICQTNKFITEYNDNLDTICIIQAAVSLILENFNEVLF